MAIDLADLLLRQTARRRENASLASLMGETPAPTLDVTTAGVPAGLEPQAEFVPAGRLDEPVRPSTTLGDLIEGPAFAVNAPAARPSAVVRAEQALRAQAESEIPPIQQGAGAALLSKLFGRPVGLGAGPALAAREAAVTRRARELGAQAQKTTLAAQEAAIKQATELRNRAIFIAERAADPRVPRARRLAYLQGLARTAGFELDPAIADTVVAMAESDPANAAQLIQGALDGSISLDALARNRETLATLSTVRQQATGPESISVPRLAAIAVGAVRDPTMSPQQADAALRRLQAQGTDLPTLAVRLARNDPEAARAVEHYLQITGQRAEATATGSLRGSALPEATQELLARAESLGALIEQVREARDQLPNIIGPIKGRVADVLARWSQSASLTPQQIAVQAAIASIQNQYVYMTTGKQINETEVARLARVNPDMNLPWETFWARVDQFEREVNRIVRNRLKYATTPAGQLPSPPEPPALSPAPRRQVTGEPEEVR